jgi:K+-transporting ATPase ATPase B chain
MPLETSQKRGKSALSGTTFSPGILMRALASAFVKLNPMHLTGNPVILATEVVAALATVSTIAAVVEHQPLGFPVQIAAWLWATVLFANFAESVAEGRGKAAADSLRAARVTTKAKLLVDERSRATTMVAAHELQPGQIVLVEAGDQVPSDGEIVEGVASVNEAAITGESAPVIREAGGDRSAVTGGSPTGSRCASPPPRARPSSTA